MSMLDDRTLTQWLLADGGLAVRYRTATELLPAQERVDAAALADELLSSAPVRHWLPLLDRPGGVGHLHSSQPSAFENAMGKLFELGLRAGMPALDEKTAPFRSWLAEKLDAGTGQAGVVGGFYVRLVAGTLARSGYWGEKPVRDALLHTLARLACTAASGSCDIWLRPEECRGFPNACRGKPIIRPEFLFGGKTPLPLIHDLYGLSGLPSETLSAATRSKVRAVVGYVLRPEFQALPDGYGYLSDTAKRQVWAGGWGVYLPGTRGFSLSHRDAAFFVQRLELMAHFSAAARSGWFRSSLQHLEQYRTKDGTYRLPSRYLSEKRTGYYVHGAYMGLGENRRTRHGLEIESTFRVLKIKRLAGVSSVKTCPRSRGLGPQTR
ncbi:MAG: hypothetical protein FJ279_14455 [Planctomycetes bacterium]|nr:hypothetical protein [Planctomycetota bacterium]